jgi:hypothetical protein
MTNAESLTATADAPNLDQVIGENVHRLMWRAQENQSQLAPKWGMSQPTLSLKLRGRRPWFASEIDMAARHFGVSRDSLFESYDDQSPLSDSNRRPPLYKSGALAN